MKQIIAIAALLLVLVLCAPIAPVGALALSGSDGLLPADLDSGIFEFDYVPMANSEYALFLFSDGPGDASASAEIIEDGEIIASGEGRGRLCSAWLAAGQSYHVRVRGSGKAILEMARSALSRSWDQPLVLAENEPYEKMIARAGDAHWYAFTAQQSASMLISCVPAEDMRMEAKLFDADGACIAQLDPLGNGAALRLETIAGESYVLRISAPDGGEGGYAVTLHRPDEQDPTVPAFDAASIVIPAGGRADLAGEAGEAALVWVSENPGIARVLQDGSLLGVSPGETTVIAHGMDGFASLAVRVEFVPVEAVSFIGGDLNLSAGDDNDLHISILPENASDSRLRFEIADPSVAAVSRSGVVRALKPGSTEITVFSVDGDHSDTITLHVSEAARRYRALIVGEENYPLSADKAREGAEASAGAVKSLLGTVEFENAAYMVRTGMDLSRAELIAAIRQTFQGASEKDISLLYITSHGYYSGGMSFLELSDGSVLSARDLERELRRIPGTVAVIIDACASGGFIGAASDRAAFADGIAAPFASAGIRGGKYRVIASAALDEDSYRIALGDGQSPGRMTTVLARALCDGAGWDIDRNARSAMDADSNYDGSITLAELQIYLKRRVSWYMDMVSDLTGEDYRQSVQVYPDGDPLVLFERNS